MDNLKERIRVLEHDLDSANEEVKQMFDLYLAERDKRIKLSTELALIKKELEDMKEAFNLA